MQAAVFVVHCSLSSCCGEVPVTSQSEDDFHVLLVNVHTLRWKLHRQGWSVAELVCVAHCRFLCSPLLEMPAAMDNKGPRAPHSACVRASVCIIRSPSLEQGRHPSLASKLAALGEVLVTLLTESAPSAVGRTCGISSSSSVLPLRMIVLLSFPAVKLSRVAGLQVCRLQLSFNDD